MHDEERSAAISVLCESIAHQTKHLNRDKIGGFEEKKKKRKKIKVEGRRTKKGEKKQRNTSGEAGK